MSLINVEKTIDLDVYDHDTTPSAIKAIQMDAGTRTVFAVIRNSGQTYDIGQNASVSLIVLRPDKTKVQITGEPYPITETTMDGETITYYGVSAELTQLALAVKGNLKAQFKIASGEQELRTEIFAINNGEALDAGDGDWAGDLDGHNLDEMAQDIEDTKAAVSEMETDVSDLKEGLTSLDVIVNGDDRKITYIANEYVSGNGSFIPYNGWSRTDYIDVSGIEAFEYSNTGIATDYNCFYDANKSPLTFTRINKTDNGTIAIPQNAKYFAYSNPTNQIELITWLNAPHINGIVDDVKDLSDRMEDIKIVIPDKIVALQNEEFDVHYDNVIANYDAKCISYKESFGSAPYGMKNLARCKNANVGTYTFSMRFGVNVPSSYNAASLPTSMVKKSLSFKVINLNSGSGLNRKVLLIGDSWTANGVYARELRNLFADNNEPMNITLLGTMGDGAEDVGASNGYHEGHGGWSSKTYCTMASTNTYTNHFYNPSSQTFDFAYYMNYCGYSSVDDVFINLGINDVENIEDFDEIISYYDEMITSIKTYDPNIRIFIGLCGLPAEYEYTTPHSRTQRIKARRLFFHERLMSEYGEKENENLFIVPLHLSIDTEHDFPTKQKARSYRDSTLVSYCTDIVHPSSIAYNKIADRIRTYIKYAETI